MSQAIWILAWPVLLQQTMAAGVGFVVVASLFPVHIPRTKYGMHPLTVTWAPHIYTEWGFRNFERWIHAGHDNLLALLQLKDESVLTRS